MAADVFFGLCYCTYELVINAIQKLVYVCKNNYNANNQALHVLWYAHKFQQLFCCQYT